MHILCTFTACLHFWLDAELHFVVSVLVFCAMTIKLNIIQSNLKMSSSAELHRQFNSECTCFFMAKKHAQDPESTFSKHQQCSQLRTLNKYVLQGLNLGTEYTALLRLRIKVRSVSVWNYQPLYNPPLELCCSFFKDQLVQGPAAAVKELSMPRNSVHLD